MSPSLIAIRRSATARMGNELHTIRDVYGTPLKAGIWMHMCTDIGRLTSIDFAPKYWLESGLVEHNDAEALKKFMREQGVGIEILRSDWEYIFDCKLDGYARGIHIHADTNAALYQIAATGGTVGLQIDSLIAAGLAVTNSRFDGTDAGILGNGGSVAQFNNCIIGGKAKFSARLEGRLKLSFQNCTFASCTDYAVLARQGALNLFGCVFKTKSPHVRLEAGVERAHILGNRCDGEFVLQNESVGDVQVTTHDFHFAHPRDENVKLPPDPKPATEKLFNVVDFGAKTEDRFDNAGAFGGALAAAEKAGGGTVYVPAGYFWFSKPVTVPSGVELRGCFDVPHHTWSGGSVLLNLSGRGDENGTPFMSLAAKSGIRGLTIWYPEQIFETSYRIRGRFKQRAMVAGLSMSRPATHIKAQTLEVFRAKTILCATSPAPRFAVDYGSARAAAWSTVVISIRTSGVVTPPDYLNRKASRLESSRSGIIRSSTWTPS